MKVNIIGFSKKKEALPEGFKSLISLKIPKTVEIASTMLLIISLPVVIYFFALSHQDLFCSTISFL